MPHSSAQRRRAAVPAPELHRVAARAVQMATRRGSLVERRVGGERGRCVKFGTERRSTGRGIRGSSWRPGLAQVPRPGHAAAAAAAGVAESARARRAGAGARRGAVAAASARRRRWVTDTKNAEDAGDEDGGSGQISIWAHSRALAGAGAARRSVAAFARLAARSRALPRLRPAPTSRHGRSTRARRCASATATASPRCAPQAAAEANPLADAGSTTGSWATGSTRRSSPSSTAFAERWRGTYVEDRLRNDWLLELGRRRDWANFNAEFPRFRMNDDREVTCYALRRPSRSPASDVARRGASPPGWRRRTTTTAAPCSPPTLVDTKQLHQRRHLEEDPRLGRGEQAARARARRRS